MKVGGVYMGSLYGLPRYNDFVIFFLKFVHFYFSELFMRRALNLTLYAFIIEKSYFLTQISLLT